MYLSRATIIKLFLSLVLALSAFSGAVAQADGAPPSPPTASAVALNTYGSLPVIVLNLTQSPINFNISTNSTAYGSALPLAAGLPGVYYPNGGATSTFTNVMNPSVPVDPYGINSASLTPAATLNGSNAAFSNTYGWISMFTVFPSWTQRNTYEYVQYVTMSNIKNQGAAADSYTVVSGWPSSNAKNITKNTSKNPTGMDYTDAYALNASQRALTSINLNLLANGQTAATYKININSLGGGTSGSVPTESQGFSILGFAHTALDVITDIVVVSSGDVLGIVDLLANVPSMISGIVDTIDDNNNSANSNITTDSAYPAKSAGINVTAAGNSNVVNLGTGAPPANATGNLTAVQGDSQSLVYEMVQTGGTQALPLFQQNAVIVTTWRQKPADNYGVALPNGTDVLFVTVINQGIYASNQVQQYINNNSATQMARGAKYQPTKAQAQDSQKILELLTAIAQKNPQDAKYIIEMFGVHGKYSQIKNDPADVQNMHAQLKAIFERHGKDLPAAAAYLAKLAQKG